MDTSILRACGLDSSSADLLRTIRTVGVEGVAAPWMVLEELAAQKAVQYRQKYDAALQAVKALGEATPWELDVPLGPCNLTRLRAHWRKQYETVVDWLPTSESALREGMFREANALAPCKKTEGSRPLKVGGRDAAIWLSAIEYTREHPGETVYFVSGNTKDFQDGTAAYAFPMDEDVAGLGGRFVHLTSLDQVIARFTQPTETNDALVSEILTAPGVLKAVKREAKKRLGNDAAFACTTSVGDLGQEVTVASALGWLTARAVMNSVEEVQSYRIGEHVWCTAVVRWHVGGMAFVSAAEPSVGAVGCSWTTSVLFTPNIETPRLTVLRHDLPQPLTAEEFTALRLNGAAPVSVAPMIELLNELGMTTNRRTLPRAYEGTLLRKTSVEQQLRDLLAEVEAEADE
ncbi:hypothetical protein P1P68_02430 [Streptomyces scabiei]|uniref:PIN domain-containing protein n=1 Tax=Streptomyces scabiei TaxID=1930 RepID=UPI00298FFDA5|nr:hypothetical protein [Streptomyces scabiei]MDW8803692.1 hypothetical protein [Streptomyces scabiei]